MGEIDRFLQAEADMEQAVDDLVEQVPATACLFGRGGGPGEAGEIFAPPGLG